MISLQTKLTSQDLKSGWWWLWVTPAPNTSLHFVEIQAVPAYHNCSVCPYWCPYVNLKEFPDGLIKYLLRTNVFEGKHFLRDCGILHFSRLMVDSYSL